MALTINTNIASLNAQRNLTASQTSLSTSMQRLSSGLRINSSRDVDTAFVDRIRSQMEKLNAPLRNASDTVSLLQRADGSLSNTNSILSRMRELATQATYQTNSDSDRSELQNEFDTLTEEITKIGNDTSFNGHSILNGSYEVETQSSTIFDESRSIKINDMRSEALGVSDLSLSTVDGAKDAISKIDEALKMVNEQRATFGKEQNHLEHKVSSLSTSIDESTASTSRIQDTDFAAETASLTRSQILQQAGTSMLAQANSLPNNVLYLLRG